MTLGWNADFSIPEEALSYLSCVPMTNRHAQSAVQDLVAYHPDERVRLASVQTLVKWADLNNLDDKESFLQVLP